MFSYFDILKLINSPNETLTTPCLPITPNLSDHTFVLFRSLYFYPTLIKII